MRSILHVLPHGGGGGEGMVDMLAGMDGWRHDRRELSSARDPVRALPSIAMRWPGIARTAAAYDILHAHGDVAAVLTAPLLRRHRSVWHTHGLHFLRRARGPRLGAARASVRRAIGAANRTVCTSHAERDELAQFIDSRLAERLVVVHNGVALPDSPPAAERAALRRELGVGEDQVLCLYLGQLEERKAPGTLVDAVESVPGARMTLALAGDGPLLEPLRARVSPAVRVLGFRDDPERLLAAADIFVMPSSREGLSLAVLEAMSHSLAVVVSDGAGNPEAVGDAGIVFPAGDSAALARTLARLTRDLDERRRLGDAARARVENGFRREHFVDRMARVYGEVLAEPARA